MLNLVFKDILIQRKSIGPVILMAIIMLISFQASGGNGAYVASSIASVFILIAGAFGYDEKNKGDVLINSLPVRRRDIVLSRYLSLLVFSLISLSLAALTGAAMKIAGIPLNMGIITPSDVLAALIVIISVFSIYIPIYFKFGYLKSRFVNIALYLILLIISGLIVGLRQALSEEPGNGTINEILHQLYILPLWSYYCFLIVFLLSAITISIKISIMVYKKREF